MVETAVKVCKHLAENKLKKMLKNRVFASGEPAFCKYAIFQRLFVVFFQHWAHRSVNQQVQKINLLLIDYQYYTL